MGACFPRNSQVYVFENGQKIAKNMEDIQLGDLLLSEENGKEVYSDVITWIHHNKNTEVEYLEI